MSPSGGPQAMCKRSRAPQSHTHLTRKRECMEGWGTGLFCRRRWHRGLGAQGAVGTAIQGAGEDSEQKPKNAGRRRLRKDLHTTGHSKDPHSETRPCSPSDGGDSSGLSLPIPARPGPGTV